MWAKKNAYCGMFMDFVGFPYPQIYVQKSNELFYNVIQQTSYSWNYFSTNQQKFDKPQTLAPTNSKYKWFNNIVQIALINKEFTS